MTMRTTFLTLILCSAIFCKPLDDNSRDDPTCGYNSCHQTFDDKLNVHLVPHSHDDVGWRKTVDQYYYGINHFDDHPGIPGVQNILDTVVQSLKDNPDRRFIQVETAFFMKWWEQQNEDIRNDVQNLVNNGQLEIVSGGWTMNDEATTNYQSIIDQFTLGLRTINDTLGECAVPRVGWQIDPFGHSKVMATILAQLGFDGLFFTRLDHRDLKKRNSEKNTEFIWRGNGDLGTASDIFTSIIYRDYNAPDTFCWDVQCKDLPIIDDKDSFDYNVEERVKNFTEYIKKQQLAYPTNNILITMGGDFTFGAAHMYYANIDRFIKGFQTFNKDVNMIYSTPSCYIKAVNDAAKKQAIDFSLKTDDFLPYASRNNTYWTGFYTSRPTMKRMERMANNLLQVAQQMVVQANAYKENFQTDLNELKKVMGIMQHHDAVTGTEKQHVADDYTYLLTKAMKEAETNIHTVIFDLLKVQKSDTSVGMQMESCLMSNVTRCTQSNAIRFTVAVYNPSSHPVSHYVRLPVTSTNYDVLTLTGNSVKHQIVPSIDTFDDVPGQKSLYDLTFYADDIPPLGVKYFYVSKQDDVVNTPNLIKSTKTTKLGNDDAGFSIDDQGYLNEVTLNGKKLAVKQEFLYYRSAKGDNKEPEDQASGAYVFRPSDIAPIAVGNNKIEVKVYEGELFDEVHQSFSDWLKQVIRVYKSENHIEFDWVVGPTYYFDNFGVEVISRFTTSLNTANVFYTDSNGRELVKRVRDHRDTFDYTDEEPVSGNYYPVTSRIVLKDANQDELVLVNDRSQGGSSLSSGQVELMIHRHLKDDDNYGVNEALNEVEYYRPIRVRGQHYLLFADAETSSVQQRKIMEKNTMAPWTFIGDATDEAYSFNNMRTKMQFQFSGIRTPLPENARILTLDLIDSSTLLLRLEHLFGKGEHSTLSEPVSVNIKEMFTLYKVLHITETTLGANQLKKDNIKLNWTATPEDQETEEIDSVVVLNPMEIRTFILEVQAIEPHTETGGSYANVPHAFLIFLFLFSFLY
ncbi:hypothetical protein FQR65_LT15119 [Abscondita terminalis]|nr:hypothetical protein FQR65_LT15119 [Abscondita terminalis]